MSERRVRAYPRLHLGLLDVAGVTPRRFGGGGLSIDALPVQVHAKPSRTLHIEARGFADQRSVDEISAALRRAQHEACLPAVSVTIEAAPPQHVGLGSKTALILAALRAAFSAHEQEPKDRVLQLLSGRGGTSGVGIHTFFLGGFVIDGGHAAGVGPLLPSSAGRPADVPPVVVRCDVPPDWQVSLILPDGRRIEGAGELEFFRANTPIPGAEAETALAIMYHGIAPAFLLADLDLLRHSLKALQAIGFKRCEIANQSDTVAGLLEQLDGISTGAVGMSSLGPLVFFVSHAYDQAARDRAEAVSAEAGAKVLAVATGRNSSYDLA